MLKGKLIPSEFEDDAAALQGLKRGRLRIAAVTTTEYFLPDLMGPFARQYRSIQTEIAVENRDAVVARLERGDDELASMMRPPAHLAFAQKGVSRLPRMALGGNEAIKYAVRAGLRLAVQSRQALAA